MKRVMCSDGSEFPVRKLAENTFIDMRKFLTELENINRSESVDLTDYFSHEDIEILENAKDVLLSFTLRRPKF